MASREQLRRAAQVITDVHAEDATPWAGPTLETEADDDTPADTDDDLPAQHTVGGPLPDPGLEEAELEERVQAPGGPPPGRGYQWGGVGPGNNYIRHTDAPQPQPVSYDRFKGWLAGHGIDLDTELVDSIIFDPATVGPGRVVAMRVRTTRRDLAGRVIPTVHRDGRTDVACDERVVLLRNLPCWREDALICTNAAAPAVTADPAVDVQELLRRVTQTATPHASRP